jgi:hypothetical protein
MTKRSTLCMLVLLAFLVPAPARSHDDEKATRVVRVPLPPHPGAIGTAIDAIHTYVTKVTISPPSRVRRHGLRFEERRGEIEGIGWGGTDIANNRMTQHYTYRVSYVLRVPPRWDGTLVVFRHGAAPMTFWIERERLLGDRATGRFFHEVADRAVSDVALDPRRRWAFFSVNQTPLDKNGQFTAFLLDDDGTSGAPVQTMADVPIARDTTRVGERLLEWLRGRSPRVTLGVGHSAGAVVNLKLNTGRDPRFPTLRTGDNHLNAYDPASGRIYDGFIWWSGNHVPLDPQAGLSAQTLMVVGEAETPALLAATQHVAEIAHANIDAQAWTRIYAVRNMPHIDADLVLDVGKRGLDFTTPQNRHNFLGGGDRLKPLMAALLDALKRWIRHGAPPPASVFNGVPIDANGDGDLEALAFPQAGGETTSRYGFVDDPAADMLSGPLTTMTSVQNTVALARWAAAQRALGVVPASVLLPEVACRRGTFALVTSGPVGAAFTPYEEQEFFARWGSSSAHQSCRIMTVDQLAERGLYDPAVVTIDIDPQTFPNVIDLSAGRVVTVAIFSTRGFDATRVNVETLRIGGAGGPGNDVLTSWHRRPTEQVRDTRIEDVNSDGRLDLVVDFAVAGVDFPTDHIVADVWGRTRNGIPFSGMDLVRLVR